MCQLRVPLLIALAAELGCVGPDHLWDPALEGIDRVALVELDESGGIVRATGLGVLDSRATLSLDWESHSGLVVGWSSELLDAAGAPSDADLEGDLLRAPESCEQQLPWPLYAGRWQEDELEPIPTESVPPLTAAWLGRACPDIDPETLSLDFDCLLARCPSRIERTGACGFRADLTGCDAGVLEARAWQDGTLCLGSSRMTTQNGPWDCQAAESAELAVGALGCHAPECRVDVYRAPETPPFRIESAPIFGEVRDPYDPPAALTSGAIHQVPRNARFIGYTHDFVVLDEAVVVSVGPGAPLEACQDASGQLSAFDLETLAPSWTATAPPCLEALSPELDGGGFVGAFAENGRFVIERFDARGRRRGAGVTLTLRPETERVQAIVRAGDPSRLVVLFSRFNEPWSALSIHDARSLQPIGSVRELPGRDLVSLSASGEREIVLGDTNLKAVSWVNLETGAERGMAILPRDVARNDRALMDITVISESRALVSIARNNAALYVADASGEFRSHTVSYDEEMNPISAHPLPGGAGLFLVAGTDRRLSGNGSTDWPSFVAVFDEPRRELRPGTWRIGYGPASRISSDHSGRTWLLLSWEPSLVRLTP
ncbi:MAG: hypothetical protein HYV07_27000 [Deltaproteobacteria bacterium]|nr:hypothetical protein [Deltaproteobacteria bacterium]